MEKLLLGIEEAAQVIGLSKYTVRAYVQKKLIRTTRIGTRVLIPVDEIRRIAAKGLNSNPANN
jgi:excisionase family DNA binding protein